MNNQAAVRKVEDHYADDHSTPAHILAQIEKCLRKGCVVRIEYTPRLAPRFSPWKLWGTSSMYNGDIDQLMKEVDQCLAQHQDHFIRLSIEDFSCHSRFSFVMHSPLP